MWCDVMWCDVMWCDAVLSGQVWYIPALLFVTALYTSLFGLRKELTRGLELIHTSQLIEKIFLFSCLAIKYSRYLKNWSVISLKPDMVLIFCRENYDDMTDKIPVTYSAKSDANYLALMLPVISVWHDSHWIAIYSWGNRYQPTTILEIVCVILRSEHY